MYFKYRKCESNTIHELRDNPFKKWTRVITWTSWAWPNSQHYWQDTAASGGRFTDRWKGFLPLSLAIDIFQEIGDGSSQRHDISSGNNYAQILEAGDDSLCILAIDCVEHIHKPALCSGSYLAHHAEIIPDDAPIRRNCQVTCND